MSESIILNGALAAKLRKEAQAQETSVDELLNYLLQLAECEGRRREVLKEIKQISEQIAREFKPEKIILFGSYAYGIPRQGSDVDLMVIMPFEGAHSEQAIKIYTALGTLLPLDLLVRRPEEIAERIKIGDTFIRQIIEQGKVLYEAKHAGMDRKGRRGIGSARGERRARVRSQTTMPRVFTRSNARKNISKPGWKRLE